MFQYLLIWLLRVHISLATKEYFGEISAFPTNFFRETVFKFKNDRPTIGIVAMEMDGVKFVVDAPHSLFKDYFGSSFVKLVESAGGRAVPIKEV